MVVKSESANPELDRIRASSLVGDPAEGEAGRPNIRGNQARLAADPNQRHETVLSNVMILPDELDPKGDAADDATSISAEGDGAVSRPDHLEGAGPATIVPASSRAEGGRVPSGATNPESAGQAAVAAADPIGIQALEPGTVGDARRLGSGAAAPEVDAPDMGFAIGPIAPSSGSMSRSGVQPDNMSALPVDETSSSSAQLAVQPPSGTHTPEAEPVNSSLTITSAGAVSVAENLAGTVYSVVSTSPDASTALTYSLSGTDAALFDIDANTGAISFKAPADFEDVRDAGGNNIYDVKVTVSDGANTATQDVAITVTNVNEGPTITSGAAASVAENSSGTVYTASATDPDAGTTLTYALSGADAALFDIDAQTGAVSFKSSPDAEDARDAGGDNVYDVKVIASDGTNTTAQDVAITVTDVNEGPIFTSATAVSAVENATGTVYTAAATDPDAGATLTYSLSGTDAALFDIDANTGAVSFKAPADFEDARDAGGNNVYDVKVTVSDGASTATQDVAITVTNQNEGPTITSGAAASVAENSSGTVYTVAATDPDAGTTLTYALSGADAALFDIDAQTGAVSFKAAPDAEDARDAGGDNVYDVKVIASDGTNTTTKDVAITVTDVNEGPTFTSVTAVSVSENTAGAVYTAAATDPDAGATLTYSLSGTDAALFDIDANTGAISFKAPADFEDARDAGGNNVYDVKVTVSDGTNTATQDVAITVANQNEGPTITSGAAVSVAENSSGTVYTAAATDPDAGTTLTYALSGADAALFDIDAQTGAVSFKSSPDAEDARDADGDNVYDVKVTASDGTNTTTQDVAITVTDVNEGPIFTSATAVSVSENAAGVVYTAAATDPDAGATLTYSLSGTDAALFDIDANTGAISFKAPADFEDARDAGGNNVYDVKVTVSDGANTATQDVAITVTNVNEGPTITSGAAASVAENSSGTVYTAAATDPDAGTTLTYALSGADAALFDIDAQTGAVSFKSSPDAEDARDAGGDNVYDVKVIASDGTNTATKDVAISVTGVNETGPSLSFNGGAIVNVISVSDFEHGVAPTAAVSAGLTLDGWSIKVGTTFQVLGESQVRIGSNGAYGNSVDIAYDGMDQTIQRDFSGLEPNATYVFTLRASSGGSDGTAKYDDNGIAVTINGVTSTIPPANLIRGFQTFTIEFQTDANGKAHIEVAGTDPTSDGEGAVIDTFKILKGTASDFSPVLEGAATGTVVGTAVAVDLDVNDSFTYALTDDAGGRFAIDPATGVITVADGSKLDFETSAFHDIKVRVTDSGGLSSESTVTVAIADQLPVFVGSHVLSVAENTTGAFFTPSVSDGAGSTVQLYSLSGADAALFNIDAATGAIRFKSAPNFEMTTDVGRDHVYDVTLSARNATGVTTQEIQITLTNVVEANEVASRYGGDGDDVLIGDAGKSDLFGGAGNDILIGLAGADLLSGGTGNDTASYAGSNAAVNVLLGGTSTGGHAAGDTFQSIENLIGSSFGDVLKGDGGDNIIEGGGGGDAISGGPGSDTASYAGAATGVFADLSRRQLNTGDAAGDVYSSVENVLGSAFDDTLGGNALDNVLTGGAGNDQLMGYAGNDTLYGDAGADLFIMNVGAGVDTVFGGAGGGWIDVIELRDSVNVTYNGGFPGDWTMVLTSGQVIGTEAEAFNLSADAAGYLENTDGTRVNFSEIEQIRW